MLHFGVTSILDLLSWIVMVALGAKVAATLIVLVVDKSARDRPGWGSILWWVTKLTPVIVVPCLAYIAVLQNDANLLHLSMLAGLFVLVAVPMAIRKRRTRIGQH